MINLLSESAYVAQTSKIRAAITNKVNAIKASFTRIGAKLGATINWLDDVESALDDKLTAINTELTDKGSTQAADFSEVAKKISDIETGITPTGQIAITANGAFDVTNYASASVSVADSEFVGLVEGTYTQIYNEDVTEIANNVFQNNIRIVSVNFPNSVNTGENAFLDCSNLASASFENAITINTLSFKNCTNLKSTFFPNVETIKNYAFRAAKGLEIIDLPKCKLIEFSAFMGGLNKFKTIILRSDSVCTLQNTNAFINTPLDNGTGGTVYVPQDLVSSYQSATNWSALKSATFLPIEGSEYE